LIETGSVLPPEQFFTDSRLNNLEFDHGFIIETLDKHQMKRWREKYCLSIVSENN